MKTETHPDATSVFHGDKGEVQHQVDRLLATDLFCRSKRLPSFLRFVVSQTLKGHADQLKERTIGIEVFGRPADYDTAADPIVRVAAAEIRKRLALHYLESKHAPELRITLPLGCYIPRFENSPSVSLLREDPDILAPGPHQEDPSLHSHPIHQDGIGVTSQRISSNKIWGTASKHLWLTVFSLGVLIAIAVFALCWRSFHHRETNFDAFWRPLLHSDKLVIFCLPIQPRLGTVAVYNAISSSNSQRPLGQPELDTILLGDLRQFINLAQLLDNYHHVFTFTTADVSTVADLRRGPTILIGAFDNPWALRLTRGLRYHFGNDPETREFWIEDSQSHPRMRWSFKQQSQFSTGTYLDYAIVARFIAQDTGEPVIVAAGLTCGGTMIAGDFISQPDLLDRLTARAPHNWGGKNVEVVLSTQVIDGIPAAPQIIATYFW